MACVTLIHALGKPVSVTTENIKTSEQANQAGKSKRLWFPAGEKVMMHRRFTQRAWHACMTHMHTYVSLMSRACSMFLQHEEYIKYTNNTVCYVCSAPDVFNYSLLLLFVVQL